MTAETFITVIGGPVVTGILILAVSEIVKNQREKKRIRKEVLVKLIEDVEKMKAMVNQMREEKEDSEKQVEKLQKKIDEMSEHIYKLLGFIEKRFQ